MKAIILAAGRGSRLGGITDGLPKALVRIAGKPLIDYTLDFLDHPSVAKKIVVGGFQWEKMVAALTNRPGITWLPNPDFQLGSIVTLWQAREELCGDDILLLNADHIYPAHFLEKLLRHPQGIIAACDFDRPLADDDMKISETPKGFVGAISKKLTQYNGGYIGMTLIRKDSLPSYTAALESLWISDKKAVVEEILQRLIDQQRPPHIADLSGSRWFEVDTPEDLTRTEQEIKKSGGITGV